MWPDPGAGPNPSLAPPLPSRAPPPRAPPLQGPALTAPPPPLPGPRPPHLALRGTVIDGVLVHSTQVLHEAVRAQDPAHLDQEDREGVRPLGAQQTLSGFPGLPLPPTIVEGGAPPNSGCLTFQPVTLKVLPALPMVRVRSHMPGRLAAQDQRERLLRRGWGHGVGAASQQGPGLSAPQTPLCAKLFLRLI